MGRSVGNRGGMSRESRVLRGISTDRNLTLWVTKGEERVEERGIKEWRNNRKKRDKWAEDEPHYSRITRKGRGGGGRTTKSTKDTKVLSVVERAVRGSGSDGKSRWFVRPVVDDLLGSSVLKRHAVAEGLGNTGQPRTGFSRIARSSFGELASATQTDRRNGCRLRMAALKERAASGRMESGLDAASCRVYWRRARWWS